MNEKIKLIPILKHEKCTVCCPYCGIALIHYKKNHSVLGSARRWLITNECIDDFWEKRVKLNKHLTAMDYSIRVGCDICCTTPYFVIDASFFDPWVCCDDIAEFRGGLMEEKYIQNYLAHHTVYDIDTWIVEQIETPVGMVFNHTFGPFEVHNPKSRSYFELVERHDHFSKTDQDFAANYLLKLWDDLCEIKNTLTK